MPHPPLGLVIFLASFHALNEDVTLTFERDMALIEHLDDLHYDEVWGGAEIRSG